MPLLTELSEYFAWLAKSGTHLLLFFPIFCASVLAMVSLFLWSGRMKARATKRSSYEKGAKQVAVLTLLVGWLTLLGSLGALLWAYRLWDAEVVTKLLATTPVTQLLVDHTWCLFLVVLWLLLFLHVLGLSLGLLFWKIFGKNPLLLATHTWLSIGIGLLFALTTIVLVLVRDMLPPLESADLTQLAETFVTTLLARFGWDESKTLSVFLETLIAARTVCCLCLLPLLFGMPAVLGSCGLFLLRPFQEFGRDHYAIVLTWCLGWAKRMGIFLCLILVVFLFMQLSLAWEMGHLALLPLCSELLLLLFFGSATFLWAAVYGSSVPLRQKFWVIFADILACCALAVLVLELVKE